MLTIPSYNDGEFDPSVPSGEPETPEPPPTEEDLQLESRAPGSENAVIEAARQRDTPAARSQRAAEKADRRHQPRVDLAPRCRLARPRSLRAHLHRRRRRPTQPQAAYLPFGHGRRRRWR